MRLATRLRSPACAIALVACAVSAGAATRYDPRLHFRTLHTEHFDIHWHQGEAREAQRLAGIAERVRTAMEPDLGTPPGRVQVILVDQSDLSNGWATPVPYDAIEITVRPPSLDASIGNTTDWLRLVFTHEYTHILHLDRSAGVMRGVRRIFGRVPLAFSNAFLPVWQIEGIAAFEETRHTGEGRAAAGDFRVIVDAAARHGRFEPEDRVSGGLDAWPSGDAPYAYGAYFHAYLADRFGVERIAQLRDATARRLPFFGSGAFTHVFGESLDALWSDFEAARAVPVAPSATDAAATRLTHHGFQVTALAADDGRVFYAIANADAYPALMRLDEGATPERIAWRYQGDATTVHGDWVVFDQVSPVRAVAWYSDLYAVHADGGPVRELTHDARAAEPAFSPDGTRLACVVEHEGARALAIVPFDPSAAHAPTILVTEAGSDFGAPRWSPDGRHLVAERRRPGTFEIVDVEVATRVIHPLLASTSLLATPIWRADGQILFSAEVDGRVSNVFVLDPATGRIRRITDSVTGARMPQLSADARILRYIGYTPDGYDLFSVATNEAHWTDVDPAVFRGTLPSIATTDAAEASTAPPARPTAPYSPLPTLKPTYWSPVVYSDAGEVVLGAGTAMADVLGRHAYAAQAGWSSRARPDWSLSYAYDRWRPTIFANYSDDTDPVEGGDVHSRQFEGGALLSFRHLRRIETLFTAIDLERDRLTCDGVCRTRVTEHNRGALQVGWLHDTRRLFGYSISVEEGHSIAASVESTVAALGSDVDARAAVFDARVYHRAVGAHTVVALRGAAAAAWGALGDRRVFSAAGSGPAGGIFGFDRGTVGLLRGFAPDDLVATRAAVVNADLRFPLARPERGAGAFPIFFRAVHGAVFADTGSAWDTAWRAQDLRTSAGAELSIDVVLGHGLPLTFATGAAWTRDPVAARRGVVAFGRIGRAF